MTCPCQLYLELLAQKSTHDKTFENSLDGDMTKLSFVLDHEIRC